MVWNTSDYMVDIFDYRLFNIIGLKGAKSQLMKQNTKITKHRPIVSMATEMFLSSIFSKNIQVPDLIYSTGDRKLFAIITM